MPFEFPPPAGMVPPVTFPVTSSTELPDIWIPWAMLVPPPVTFPTTVNVPLVRVMTGVPALLQIKLAVTDRVLETVHPPPTVPPVATAVSEAHTKSTLITMPVFPFSTNTSETPRLAHVSQEPDPFAVLFHWLTESIFTVEF